MLVIRLSGLPFVNETYSQSKNVNLTPIILTVGTVKLPAGGCGQNGS
jgi:hypothetical protein